MPTSATQLDLLALTEAPSTTSPSLPSSLRPSTIYAHFWRFAAERQAIYFRRVRNEDPPYTIDPILSTFKFTNAYRASDRTSQYLIRHVLYRGSQQPVDVFFRCILFKLFNSIPTWESLSAKFGCDTAADLDVSAFSQHLRDLMSEGTRIYSPAYIIPPVRVFGTPVKHEGHLLLLRWMLDEQFPKRTVEATEFSDVVALLGSAPSIGPFLSYQFAVDLNYSSIIDFSENDFVLAGPGARRGIQKCFAELSDHSYEDVIRILTEVQNAEIEAFAPSFQNLWGRDLRLIDVQNLFCEIDKYSRVAFPQVAAADGRKRIKQKFRRNIRYTPPWYPPKWGLNDRIIWGKEDVRLSW